MIPVVEDFVQRFNLDDFVVVADAGLMSQRNIALLESGNYKYCYVNYELTDKVVLALSLPGYL